MSPPNFPFYLTVREGPPGPADDVVEIALLLPGWQADALEALAHQHGRTTAEMVRHVLGDYLTRRAGPR